MQAVPAFFTAARILTRLLRDKETPSVGAVHDETWPGLDGKLTPVRKFIPRRPNGEWLVLFPGASPYAEKHPAMNQLSQAASGAGFTVIIPRIPPLKALEIDPGIVDWVQHAYRWVRSQLPTTDTPVRLMGASFGGPLVLKGLASGPLKENPPASFLMYGPYYNMDTVLDYLCTGELRYDGQIRTQTVHEWGLVVFFHNFLGRIDPGYSVEGLRNVLAIRVTDDEQGAAEAGKRLSGKEREVAEALLSGQATPEVRRLANLIRDSCQPIFEALSPARFIHHPPGKIFIIHGRSDTMVPFTESIHLARVLPESRLLLTGLYKHSEMTGGGSWLHRGREALKILRFLTAFLAERPPA
ncbi:MAG: hypothetical protein ACE5D1_00465 [Fidelibacterota bacterium]